MSANEDTPALRPHGEARSGYSLDVRLWKVTKVDRKARPYQLRWVVGKVSSATFATSALAESRRSELRQAMRRGEAFEIGSGQPESEVRAAEAVATVAEAKPSLRWFEFCRKYVAGRWRMSAAKTREGMADGLAAVALAMVKRGENTPEDKYLRLAFRWGIVPANAGQEPCGRTQSRIRVAHDGGPAASRPGRH